MAILVYAEAPVFPQTLKDLIKTRATATTKKPTNEIANLQRQALLSKSLTQDRASAEKKKI